MDASAWPSLYTGVGPSHHGIYGFFDYGHGYPDDAEVVSRADVDAPALWNYLTSEGVPSAVLNMPVTHPADDIEGALVPGYLAPEDAPGSPPEVREALASALGEYRIYSRAELSADDAEKLEGYVELIDHRREAAERLLDTVDWRLAVMQVQKTDTVFHNFTEPRAFRRVYRAADEFLGSVLGALPEDTNVIVCSDHGIGPVGGYKIYPNELLETHGYVETTAEGARSSLAADKADLVGAGRTGGPTDEPGVNGANGASGADGRESSLVAGAVSTAGSALSRVGVSPADVYAAAARFGVEDALLALVPTEAVSSAGEYVDWRASLAYCRMKSEGGIRLNVAGRESAGVVAPEEYDTVREDLIDLFSGLETPDGEPAFDLVEPREAVYGGEHAGTAPDVLLRPAGMDHVLKESLPGSTFIPVPEADSHDHKLDGVFIGAGPDFEDGAAPADLSITDIAPTTMALLGRDVPARMTGRVPADLLGVPVTTREYGEVPFATGADEIGSNAAVEDRLEDLGYL